MLHRFSCSTAILKFKQLKRPSNELPQSSGVELMSTRLTASPSAPAKGKHVIVITRVGGRDVLDLLTTPSGAPSGSVNKSNTFRLPVY